mmetsp:Transcript_5064/g.13731  ORF Transcript_5064/g.13731 Transcript_5064/m.13731 type:complete len:109 (+) Transcript_5064:499-825(+)
MWGEKPADGSFRLGVGSYRRLDSVPGLPHCNAQGLRAFFSICCVIIRFGCINLCVYVCAHAGGASSESTESVHAATGEVFILRMWPRAVGRLHGIPLAHVATSCRQAQ